MRPDKTIFHLRPDLDEPAMGASNSKLPQMLEVLLHKVLALFVGFVWQPFGLKIVFDIWRVDCPNLPRGRSCALISEHDFTLAVGSLHFLKIN
jgi:hypothetical protein